MTISIEDPLEPVNRDSIEQRHNQDAPLPSCESAVASVTMDHRMGRAGGDHTRPCSACGELVRWDREHVLAMVEIFDSVGGFLRPMFCDASCWAAWASSSG